MRLDYEDFYSAFLLKVRDYKIPSLSPKDADHLFCDLLMSALSDVKLLVLLKTFKNDTLTETIAFAFKRPLNPSMDKAFLLDYVTLGMLIAWLTPYICSTTNVAQVFGSREAHFYSQRSHLGGLLDLKKKIENDRDALLASRTIRINPYLS